MGDCAGLPGGRLHHPVASTSTAMLLEEQAQYMDGSSGDNAEPGIPGAVVMRKSCQHCRHRKIRCLPVSDNSQACKACTNKGQPCIFQQQSTMGRPPKNKKRDGVESPLRVVAPPVAGSAGSSGAARQSSSSRPGTSSRTDFSSKQSSSSSSAHSIGGGASGHEHGGRSELGSSKRPRIDYAAPLSMSQPGPGAMHSHLLAHSLPPSSTHNYNPQPWPYPQTLRQAPPFPSYPAIPSSSSSFAQSDPDHTHRSIQLEPYDYSDQPDHAHTPALPLLLPLRIPRRHSQTDQYLQPRARSPQPGSIEPMSFSTAQRTQEPVHSRGTNDGPYSKSPTEGIRARPTYRLQVENDAFNAFRHDKLLDVASSHYQLLSIPGAHLASHGYVDLTASHISQATKWRAMSARAVSHRKPHTKRAPATPEYARSLVSTLWESVPVDIIALVTTGKPSNTFAVGPSVRLSPTLDGNAMANDNARWLRLLREDESTDFGINDVPPANEFHSSMHSSPYLQYAPTRSAVAQFFDAYCSRHPFASILINEKLFKEDLECDQADDLLINVIVGSALARAPCLTNGGGSDATDIGDRFFAYIQDRLLSMRVQEALNVGTCQALILWASHEFAHMRARRACSLLGTADVLLRERLKRHQARTEARSATQPGGDQAQSTWREVVDHELTLNCMWVIVMLGSWGNLSMRLPTTSFAASAGSLTLPPPSASLSASFAYSYSDGRPTTALQHIVRRTLERFSDTAQLVNLIASVKSQVQLKHLLNPEPVRSLSLHTEGEDANLARWLLEMANQVRVPQHPGMSLARSTSDDPAYVRAVTNSSLSAESRNFLIAAHAVLVLHQLLPTVPVAGEALSGVSAPTVDSLKTAIEALALLSQCIQPDNSARSRTQAMLIDAVPRIVALLDTFTSTALTSLEHFIVITEQRDNVRQLLADLGSACAALEAVPGDEAMVELKFTFDQAAAALQAVADVGGSAQGQLHSVDFSPHHENVLENSGGHNDFHGGLRHALDASSRGPSSRSASSLSSRSAAENHSSAFSTAISPAQGGNMTHSSSAAPHSRSPTAHTSNFHTLAAPSFGASAHHSIELSPGYQQSAEQRSLRQAPGRNWHEAPSADPSQQSSFHFNGHTVHSTSRPPEEDLSLPFFPIPGVNYGPHSMT